MSKFEFDPNELGTLEVGWWRAHNEKDKPRMLKFLVDQNVRMYGFNEDEARLALQSLVEGAKYHDTREWEKAVDSVNNYYEKVREKTGLMFDPRQVAELEVGWWKLHDELEFNPDKTELAYSFARLYSTEFGTDIEKMLEAGRLKAEATKEHDLAEDLNTPFEQVETHWDNANRFLISFYEELGKVLQK